MRDFKYKITKDDITNKYAVRDILRHNFSFSSRLRTRIKKNKSIFLNGVSVPVWITPEEGDELIIVMPEEKSHFEPEKIPIDVIYEDDDLLLINKQAGIVVHPTKGHPFHTIANGITQYMIDTNQSFKIRFINRLDMDTSGLLALGKNSHTQDEFVKQSKKGLVHKGYIAVVRGIIDEEEGTIDAPLGHPNPEKVQRGVVEGGSPSVTHYKVLERFDKGYTLIELKLETGRTHQIRVHMSFIGHPVVGDYLYGGDNITRIERQALHAKTLSFYQPISGKKLNIVAPLPQDILDLIEKLH